MMAHKLWMAVTIPCQSETSEAITNFLFEIGSCGAEEQDGLVKGYFEGNVYSEAIIQSVEIYLQSLSDLGHSVGKPRYEEIPFENWNHRWRNFYQPVQVTSRILVKPPWIHPKVSSEQIVVDITPGLAFGTGTHETTQLSLIFLEKYLIEGDVLLDIGTGSGILSIAGIKLGASRAVAVDIDGQALINAEENIRFNHVRSQVKLHEGLLEMVTQHRFDLICANINLAVLKNLIPKFNRFGSKYTRVILSGILTSEKNVLSTVIQKSDYTILECEDKGEWSGFVIQPNS